MKLQESSIQSIQNYFRQKPIVNAYLFGSYARATADEESDVDIFVELDYSKPIGLEFVKMKLDLEKLLNKKVELVTSKGVSKHILPFIEKDKQLIYAR